jgi:hypothetical protein
VDEAGVLHEYEDEVLGEAWAGGPVLLSWFPGNDAPAGVNVVIHEFAHKLDMENGDVDGLPRLRPGMSRRDWAKAFGEAYEAFCAEVDRGVDTTIDPLWRRAPGRVLRGGLRGVLRGSARAAQALSCGLRSTRALLRNGPRRPRGGRCRRLT